MAVEEEGLLCPRPSRVLLSSGQNGGGRGVIDKAPGEEELPMPQVGWRED